MVMLMFAVTVAFGHLLQCNAALPNVGNCTFMEYYCTIREYESHFFKKLYQESSADCGLQFWILYYRSLKKAKACAGDSKPLEVANIKEIESLYCSGLDLEIPLLFSLTPCSNLHKTKVDQCIQDFAEVFKSDKSNSSLCRKRGKAKLCAALAWQTLCNQSDKVDGIFSKVIGDFNPFCKDDKDPWSIDSDMCAPYRIPYHEPKCEQCSSATKATCPRATTATFLRPAKKSGAGIVHGVAYVLLTRFLCTAAILILDQTVLNGHNTG